MTFKEITDIDKLMECVPLVNEILGDINLLASLKDKSWYEAAAPMYKAHKDTFDALMGILEEKPKSAIETVSVVARILVEVFKDEETAPFFMQSCMNAKSAISAMVSTEEKQSEGS